MHDRSFLAAALVVLMIPLAGCSVTAEDPGRTTADTQGTWEEEMRQEREKSSSPEVKAALLDGSISDQEYAEMKHRYTSCLEEAGISVTKYGFDGAVIKPPASLSADEVHSTEARCSDESGEFPIAYFYVQMRVNPTHTDMAQAIVDCFKRAGVVGGSYGLKEYRAGDVPSMDRPAVAACSTDPEGRLGG